MGGLLACTAAARNSDVVMVEGSARHSKLRPTRKDLEASDEYDEASARVLRTSQLVSPQRCGAAEIGRDRGLCCEVFQNPHREIVRKQCAASTCCMYMYMYNQQMEVRAESAAPETGRTLLHEAQSSEMTLGRLVK